MIRPVPTGSTLIELLTGLAVAAIVATIALVSLAMAGVATARHAARIRSDDGAWMALAAIARDLDAASVWKGCNESIVCTAATSHRGPAALVVTIDKKDVSWFSESGALVRCDPTCDSYLTGVARASFLADVPGPGTGMRRTWLAEAHDDRATTIEVRITMTSGRSFARVVGRPRAH